MFRPLVIFSAFCIYFAVSNSAFGPQYPPTKGKIWPAPKYQRSDSAYYVLDPNFFNTSISEKSDQCVLLRNIIQRYGFIVRDIHRLVRRLELQRTNRREPKSNPHQKDPNRKGVLHTIDILLQGPCEETPYFGMDESYNLTVSSKVHLSSNSIWGIMRGLESWTHLFYLSPDETEVWINGTLVRDEPRYPHRGLLIDTSRHFVSLLNIQRTLDAMAMNKMNVLHWHIVDDQSFPYQSKKFPDLSRLGAYHSSLVYTRSDILMIIDYARERGIRVVPEFDVPGHTKSWGAAYPNILAKCYSEGKFVDYGPMNPTVNVTYKLLQDLFREVQGVFPDKYFHVGGDEVDMGCWDTDPEIAQFMRDNNIDSVEMLHAFFMRNVIPLLGRKTVPIVWQEVFDEGVPLTRDTIVQVWKSGNEISEVMVVLNAGYKVLYSSAWYLDHLNVRWEDMYKVDPRQMVRRYGGVNLENIVGGEACMWGEMADDRNIISRVWPRASAVAEKLWSPEVATRFNYLPPNTMVYRRLEEHACRMNRRGIRAEPPSGPGFCIGAV